MTTPATDGVNVVDIGADSDVVRVRQLVRDLSLAAKLSLVDQTKLVTATSELARNTLVYGGGGEATVQIVERGDLTGVEVIFADKGPGIDDVDLALTDGWTSGSGMGLGLSGAKRLVDEFELDTAPGEGTRVRVIKWRR
ncbi:anti-sigma regulatory factor [Nocardioides sp. Kera G14]|uniref:anti-sigma regulatory factor n=1 Tax=Nocardioides sp. Kera G14 TaxID=2884264 RepID=UPI001D11434C|nr:anti-sigma regulatory factor [Nocardioides sp. Kera G14]UDY23647.1 anti-sigma regulatory factor [Nocardioides sp. Kera G14]